MKLSQLAQSIVLENIPKDAEDINTFMEDTQEYLIDQLFEHCVDKLPTPQDQEILEALIAKNSTLDTFDDFFRTRISGYEWTVQMILKNLKNELTGMTDILES